jgi:hypothetical protein
VGRRRGAWRNGARILVEVGASTRATCRDVPSHERQPELAPAAPPRAQRGGGQTARRRAMTLDSSAPRTIDLALTGVRVQFGSSAVDSSAPRTIDLALGACSSPPTSRFRQTASGAARAFTDASRRCSRHRRHPRLHPPLRRSPCAGGPSTGGAGAAPRRARAASGREPRRRPTSSRRAARRRPRRAPMPHAARTD